MREELEKERAQRHRLQTLLRRSASEIRSLQQQLEAAAKHEAVLAEAMKASHTRSPRELLEWVQDVVQVRAENKEKQRLHFMSCSLYQDVLIVVVVVAGGGGRFGCCP